MKFPIVIHKDPGSSYGVTVPDLPGCFSAGETLDEAIAASHEAICSHIEVLLEDGESIPAQKPLEVHRADEYLADGLWALVDVDLSKISGHVRECQYIYTCVNSGQDRRSLRTTREIKVCVFSPSRRFIT